MTQTAIRPAAESRGSAPAIVAAEGVSLEPADVIAFTDGKLARFKMPKQVETEANLSGNVEFHMIWAGDDSMTPGLK